MTTHSRLATLLLAASTLTLAATISPACAQDSAGRSIIVISGQDDGGEVVFDSMSFDGDGMGGIMIDGPGGIGDFIGGAMGGGIGISRFDLDQFDRILRFSPEQTDAAKTIYEGFVTAAKATQDELKKKSAAIREAAKENEDKDVFKQLFPVMKEMRDEKEKADAAFISDYKALATNDQLARWDKVEMYRRRGKSMRGFGPLGVTGERLDLISVVQAMSLPGPVRAKADDVLDAWERDVDVKLTQRADAQKKQREAMREATKAGDFSGMMKFEAQNAEMGIALRDLNKAYAQRLIAVVPDEYASKLDLQIRKATYPQIYRERYAGKALSAAMAANDLTAPQSKQVAALQASYATDSDRLCKRAEELALKAEDEMRQKQLTENQAGAADGGGMMIERSFSTSADEADPQQEQSRKDRRDLEDRTVASLHNILTTAQIEKLPARPGASADNPNAIIRDGGPQIKMIAPGR